MKYNVSKEQLVSVINERVIPSSKLFLFTIFPLWAFILFVLFYRSNPFFVSHLVFSLHCFTFFIFIHMLYLYILSKFMTGVPLSYFIPLFIIFTFYLFIAIHKVYRSGIFVSIIKGIVACLSFLILLELYRECITIMTLTFL